MSTSSTRSLGVSVAPGVVALVETARGVQRAGAIAECEGVGRLAFGSIDFAVDIDATECSQSLLLARSSLVLASRAAGKPPPLDGVTTNLTDAAVVRAAALEAKRLGFGGKLCLHPAQIEPIAIAFRPSEFDVEWARAVLDRAQGGAVAVAGFMIDKPVLDRARRILNRTGVTP